jgi:hypothetical protein
MVDALTIALIIAISRNGIPRLFSRVSPLVSLLFLCAVLSTSTASLLLDIVIVIAVATLVGGALRAYTLLLRNGESRNALFRSGSVGTLAAVGAYGGLREALAGLCASILCICATLYEFSAYDVIFGVGGIAVLAVQTGTGVVANIASTALIIGIFVTIGTIVRSRTAKQQESSQ